MNISDKSDIYQKILSDKKNVKMILHPLTLTFVPNEKDKYMTVPVLITDNNKIDDKNKLTDYKFFTKNKGSLDTDYDKIFMSDEYFFMATIGANTFEKQVESIKTFIDNSHNINTIGYLLERLNKIFKNIHIDDKQMENLVDLYDRYYKKYENKVIPYSELYELIKNKIKI